MLISEPEQRMVKADPHACRRIPPFCPRLLQITHFPTLTITIESSWGGGARNAFTVLRRIETQAILKFVDSILAGRAIELYNFGHLRRDFTLVEDMVEGFVGVLALPPRGGLAQESGSQAPMCLCNIGNQQPVELLHVVHTIERCLGRSVQIRLMPTQ